MTQSTDAERERLLKRSPHLVPTPIDTDFYTRAREAARDAPVREEVDLTGFGGRAFDLSGGETIDVALLEGPQIVNLFAYNPHDPDERIWHQSVIREGLFVTRGTRVWGTMARNRPLLYCLEDTVVSDPRAGFGQHHLYFGGSGTPADWHYGGGDRSVPTTWAQLSALLTEREVDPALLLEDVCLFQKATIDQLPMRVDVLASDAVAGDHISFLAEVDLTVLLVLSPYIGGGETPGDIGIPAPRKVRVRLTEKVVTPLAWPYEGISYPDMARYLGEDGTRDRKPVSTPGIDYRLNSVTTESEAVSS